MIFLLYDKSNVIEGLTTFNGEMAIDDQYFYDKTFDDVVYYPNQYIDNSELENIVISGFEKCLTECNGTCVEYGITSNAYCFKKQE